MPIFFWWIGPFLISIIVVAVLILYLVRVKNLCDIIMKTLVTISVEKITSHKTKAWNFFALFSCNNTSCECYGNDLLYFITSSCSANMKFIYSSFHWSLLCNIKFTKKLESADILSLNSLPPMQASKLGVMSSSLTWLRGFLLYSLWRKLGNGRRPFPDSFLREGCVQAIFNSYDKWGVSVCFKSCALLTLAWHGRVS